MRGSTIGFFAVVVLAHLAGQSADADEVSHSHDLHFAHPLISESPSPDTKIRGDYIYRDKVEAEQHTARLEAEYAFAPWGSIEVDIPYTFRNSDEGSSENNLDNLEVGLKLATPLTRQLLVGGGIEFGLPTGDDTKEIGSNNELEIEPFLDAGLMFGDFEAVAFVLFGIPVNQDPDERDEVDLKIGYNLALSYWLVPRARVLVEFDGETITIGDADETVVNITAGAIGAPFEDRAFEIGAGVSAPLTDDEEFDIRAIVSVFFHF